jgi:hypothetical protein
MSLAHESLFNRDAPEVTLMASKPILPLERFAVLSRPPGW